MLLKEKEQGTEKNLVLWRSRFVFLEAWLQCVTLKSSNKLSFDSKQDDLTEQTLLVAHINLKQ